MPRGRPTAIEDGSLENVKKISEDKKVEMLVSAFYRTLAPKKRYWLDEWSDLYRKLPSETSAEYGDWRTSRFPFLRKIMRALSPQSRARVVTLLKASQLGATEVGICWAMYTADQNPGPMIYLTGYGEAAKEFSEQKMQPSIRETRHVYDLMGKGKSSDFASKSLYIGYRGGYFAMSGSQSVGFLLSKSVKNAFLDEEDSYPPSIGKEGSPVAMVGKRLSNFPGSKQYRVSTPKEAETSTIEPAYLAGSQEQYFVPCPRCNPDNEPELVRFTLQWENVQYSKDDLDEITGTPKDVWMVCPYCGGRIEEHEKTWMLENGDWFHETEDGELIEIGDVEKPSFWINGLYSPVGFLSWKTIVEEYYEYLRTKDKEILRVWQNQRLAQTYAMSGDEIFTGELVSRLEEYTHDVPEGAVVLTLGADVHGDRIECETVAWGVDNESWSINYKIFYGDTKILGDRDGLDHKGNKTVWQQLREHYLNKYESYYGHMAKVECGFVDAKWNSEYVHEFCRTMESYRLYPCIGSNQNVWGKGFLWRPKKRNEKFKTWRVEVYPNDIKTLIMDCLKIENPGPGYSHFPKQLETYTSKYFNGLTSEKLQKKYIGGQNVLKWVQMTGDNHPLDCRVYARAALSFSGIKIKQRKKDYEAMKNEERLVPRPQMVIRSNRPRTISRGHSLNEL